MSNAVKHRIIVAMGGGGKAIASYTLPSSILFLLLFVSLDLPSFVILGDAL